MRNTTSLPATALQIIRIYVLSRYVYLVVVVLGIIGNLFNIVIFRRKKFRSNSCSLYFIAYSINNIMSLTNGLLLWSLLFGFQFDLENTSVIFCKIRRYFTHVCFLLSSCLLTTASINRFARVRQAQLTKNLHRYIYLCKPQASLRIILLIIVFCAMVNVHVPFFFVIDDGECYARPGAYRVFFDVFFLVVYAICPPLGMMAVNIATVAQIRRVRCLVHPTVSRREYHLIVLVIAHSVFNVVLTLPFTINKFIYYMSDDYYLTDRSKLVRCITLLLAFINPGLSFFLYTLTTKSFRREFVCTCEDLLIILHIRDHRKKSPMGNGISRSTRPSIRSHPMVLRSTQFIRQ